MKLETVDSRRSKEFPVESRINGSKRLVEMFGIPHLSQCQETLFSTSYTRFGIYMQSAWHNCWQSSQDTPLCPQVTAFSQIWQGLFSFLGPGFVSMSGVFIRTNNERYMSVCIFPRRMLGYADNVYSSLPATMLQTPLSHSQQPY